MQHFKHLFKAKNIECLKIIAIQRSTFMYSDMSRAFGHLGEFERVLLCRVKFDQSQIF